jgi:hypothetical protein
MGVRPVSVSAIPPEFERGLAVAGTEALSAEIRLAFPHGFPTARARRAAAAALRAWQLSHRADDVLLVATELVQNVTRHTAGGGELRLALRPGAILVEVADTSTRPPVLRAYDPPGLGGRGLLILARVGRRWGFRPTPWAGHPGKVVWVELALTPAG